MYAPTLRASLVLALSVASSGCLVHERDPDAGPETRDAATAQDAGVPRDAVVPHDAPVLPPTSDASLPPVDEPDVGPDEMPSDDPDAGAWMDPPPATTGPCCDVGEIIGLDDPSHQATAPVVAWANGSWGVAWGDMPAPANSSDPNRALFVSLDVDARPTLPPSTIMDVGGPTALAYTSRRFAVGLLPSGLPPRLPTYLGLLDTAGALVDVTDVPDTIGDLARFAPAHAWVAATYTEPGSGSTEAFLRAWDDRLDPVGAPIDLGPLVTNSVAIVPVKSRLVALRATTDGIAQTTLANGSLARVSDGLLFRPGIYRDESYAPHVGDQVRATALRDTVIAVTLDRTEVRSAVLHPFTGAIEVPTTPVARSPAYQWPGIGADDVGGTAGVCFPDGAGPYGGYYRGPEGFPVSAPNADTIRFALLGPDGVVIGEPVAIATGLTYVAACAVAAAGPDDYVVVFWNAGWREPRHSILAAHVHVRR